MDIDAFVDFNEVEDDDHVFSLRRSVGHISAMTPGTRVLLGDRSGNLCNAEVVSDRGDLVEFVLDGGTFRASLGLADAHSLPR